MSDATKSEKVSAPRLVLGMGFLLLFVAVGIGAAMKEATDLPKYLAGASVVVIAFGGIWSALHGRFRRAD